jgi:hypothetical protein
MWLIKKETEAAFNAYVATQRTESGGARLTLVQFNTKVNIEYCMPIAEVPPLKLDPLGLTALYDGIGITIGHLEERVSTLPEAERPGHVVVVILTDGEENSSKEWGNAKNPEPIKALIQKKTKEGWTFIYLGANQDAVFEGGKIGIDSGTSLTYDVKNVGTASGLASKATSSVRQRGSFAGYTKQDRDRAAKPKEIGS